MPVPTSGKVRATRFGVPAGLLVVAMLLMAPATVSARRSKPEEPNHCHSQGLGESRAPGEVTEALEANVLSQYAVLRRAGTEADRLPPLSGFGSAVGEALGRYYPAYIRQLLPGQEGVRYFVVPGFLPGVVVPPAHCLSKRLKKERPKIVALERRAAVEPVYCIGVIGVRSEEGSPSCERFSTVGTGGGLAESGVQEGPRVELAPDGVAAVRLTFEGTKGAIVPVIENAYVFTASNAAARAKLRKALSKLLRKAFKDRKKKGSERRDAKQLADIFKQFQRETVSKVEWLDAAGQVVRAFKPVPDNVAAEAQFLRFELASGGGILGAVG